MKNRKFKGLLSMVLCIMLVISNIAYADATHTVGTGGGGKGGGNSEEKNIIATVKVINATTVEVTMEELKNIEFKWNGSNAAYMYADGKYTLTVPSITVTVNRLKISAKGYIPKNETMTITESTGNLLIIDDVIELGTAIASQADGQTWLIKDGVYNHGRFDSITAGGQTGWYFPIIANNITIIGESKAGTIITSDVQSANGNWASQNHISVWGDNVTIKNLTIKPKVETNKTIEVMGKNFTLSNVDFVQRDNQTYSFAGSLYFNPQNTAKDIGKTLVENVLVNDAWIACSSAAATAGELTLKDTTIDYRGSAYANNAAYGVISKNALIKVAEGSSFIVLVDDTIANLQTQVLDRVPAGTTVILAEGTYLLSSQLVITKPITVKGSGTVTIKPAAAFNEGTYSADKHLVSINGASGLVKLENLTISNARRTGINVWESTNVVLKDITSRDNVAAGLVVNNSVVVAENLNTSGNGWGYGINVDNGSNPSAGAPATSFTMNSGIISEPKQIVSDKGGVTIIAPNYKVFINDANKVFAANITSWYGTDSALLDTSVNFNFNNIRITDIDSVKFSLYQNGALLGTAFSTGGNLVTLWKECAPYWEKTADTYAQVTGVRTMSCAFSNSAMETNNGYWVRSICAATNTSIPNGLLVEVVVDNVTHIAFYKRV